MRDHLERADLYSPGFRFLVQLDLVRNRVKSADLYSPDFLFLFQLDVVRRSTEASFDSTHVQFQACCVMFQYDHQSVCCSTADDCLALCVAH